MMPAAPARAASRVRGGPKMASRRQPVGRFSGWTAWIGQEQIAPVRSAIIATARIAVDFIHGDYKYTAALAPAPAGPPWWRGHWASSTDGTHGYAEARLHSAS